MITRQEFTPEFVSGPSELPPNSVFVFGSNTKGIHGAGSARTALDEFGAVFGQAEGRQGDSYGIVTTDLETVELDPFPLDEIDAGIGRFVEYAASRPAERFYVTKIGTFRAGHTVDEIAELWREREVPGNVVLPREFS